MQKKKMVLCDPEADYAQQMAAYLEKDKDFPWEVVVLTDTEGVSGALDSFEAEVLLIAESVFEEDFVDCSVRHTFLLNESGTLRFQQVQNIDKYQEAEKVKLQLLKLFAEQEEKVFPMLQNVSETKVIGFYTPVKRCLQTGLAITCGQLLAQRKRVLYLNFDNYVGYPWLEEEVEGDLTTLLYYLEENSQRFVLHLKSLLHYRGNWAYIVPMQNSADLPYIGQEEWMKLLSLCKFSGLFDYIILDLNESMQGLFGILQQCHLLFTIVKEDTISKNKLEKYAFLLKQRGCENVKEKTVELVIPESVKALTDPDDYIKGELAEYAKKILEEYVKKKPEVNDKKHGV